MIFDRPTLIRKRARDAPLKIFGCPTLLSGKSPRHSHKDFRPFHAHLGANPPRSADDFLGSTFIREQVRGAPLQILVRFTIIRERVRDVPLLIFDLPILIRERFRDIPLIVLDNPTFNLAGVRGVPLKMLRSTLLQQKNKISRFPG